MADAAAVLDAAAPDQTKATPAAPKDTGALAGATRGMAVPQQMSTSDRIAQDRADIENKTPQMPVLSKPPTQTPQTDPFQAFGQPAMWMAMLGSLFTRRPFTNAVLAAGAVLQSTAQKDAEAAKQHFETWKIETENGLKMAKFQQDAYKAAIDKLKVDANAGKAELETHILAFKDEVLSQAYAHGGYKEVEKLLFARGKQAASVASGQSGLGAMLQGKVNIATGLQSDDPAQQAQALTALRDQYVKDQQGKGSTAAGRQQTLLTGVKLDAAINDMQSGDPARVESGQRLAEKILELGPGALKAPPASQMAWKPYINPDDGSQGFMRQKGDTMEFQGIDGQPIEPPSHIEHIGSTQVSGLTPQAAESLGKMAVIDGNTEAARLAGFNKADREAIINAGVRQAQAAGIDADQINRNIVSFRAALAGETSEARTTATRVGASEVAGEEAGRTFPLAREAYAKLDRGQYRPFNTLQAMVASGTNSPEQAAAVAADIAAITTMARALNPQGVPREADIEEFKRVLSQAQSPEAHQAVLDQWTKEIGAIKAGASAARGGVIDRAKGGGAAGAPPATLLKEGTITTFSNGQKWTLMNGHPQQLQ